ncbi:hypothetical protein FQA39_LY04351 [Lamprigera yunnana]|nr:hypothetical protein FQA39_LY04351 [Lamprigera yunnana]
MQRALTRNPPTTTTPSEDTNHLGSTDVAISCLWVLTPLAATVSILVVLVAMLTNQWLHTEEKMNNLSYNGTGEKDYLSKCTISGLWMLCFTNRTWLRNLITLYRNDDMNVKQLLAWPRRQTPQLNSNGIFV